MSAKNVFITGASRGIGKSIALKFASMGYDIIANYRSESALQQLEESLQKYPIKLVKLKGDVTSMEDCESMFESIKNQFGKLDVLINNAGITRDQLILRMPEEDFREVYDVNVMGTFFCMKLAFKMMLRQRYGKIVSLSSVVGLNGNSGQINYAASKGAIVAMTKSLAKEAAARNINVNAVAPGYIETDMTKKLSEDAVNKVKQSILLNRFGSTTDIAEAVYFLSSEQANYITGQVLVVDGGMSI
ncbi:MAG: 3-oxoacyl-[acyl-carrier-protein] reductase [Clostridiales bacterium]|nr:MAG: 3-oxoacyl-[acyl-carrier-protein] reductase [Clostridiales bacterium]